VVDGEPDSTGCKTDWVKKILFGILFGVYFVVFY